LFLFTAPPTPHLSTLSLHDALPIFQHLELAAAEADAALAVEDGAWPAELDRDRRDQEEGRENREGEGREGGVEGARHQRLTASRSEEHTSELQSRSDLVCRLLLEKK